MTIGNPEIIKCPSCKMLQQRTTLNSGNTIGARYYSDGKCIAPMLPEFPFLIKCPKCGIFFKITEKVIVRKRFDFSKQNRDIPHVKFMTVEELQQAIDTGLYNGDKNDIMHLRLLLWRTSNDSVRNSRKDSSESEDKKAAYEHNCREILSFFENDDDDERLLMRSEMHRNIGEFDKCKDLLAKIKEAETYKKYISFIDKACDEENIFTGLVE